MLATDIEARALALFDPDDPQAYLDGLGAPKQSQPPDRSTTPGRTHTFEVLSGVRAWFSAEGLGERLFKLVRAELQTGDPAFDDAVYVTTSTPALTAELLKCGEVRAAITDIIALGGNMQVSSVSVTITVYGAREGRVLGPRPLASLLAHIEATSPHGSAHVEPA